MCHVCYMPGRFYFNFIVLVTSGESSYYEAPHLQLSIVACRFHNSWAHIFFSLPFSHIFICYSWSQIFELRTFRKRFLVFFTAIFCPVGWWLGMDLLSWDLSVFYHVDDNSVSFPIHFSRILNLIQREIVPDPGSIARCRCACLVAL
jgi:hypothetical protein